LRFVPVGIQHVAFGNFFVAEQLLLHILVCRFMAIERTTRLQRLSIALCELPELFVLVGAKANFIHVSNGQFAFSIFLNSSISRLLLISMQHVHQDRHEGRGQKRQNPEYGPHAGSLSLTFNLMTDLGYEIAVSKP
jgi:hypothetical protein